MTGTFVKFVTYINICSPYKKRREKSREKSGERSREREVERESRGRERDVCVSSLTNGVFDGLFCRRSNSDRISELTTSC